MTIEELKTLKPGAKIRFRTHGRTGTLPEKAGILIGTKSTRSSRARGICRALGDPADGSNDKIVPAVNISYRN